MKHSTKRDHQAENRRNQLLDIALNLFAEQGIENVTIKDISKKANASQGLIYYYFTSKDELLIAVLQHNNPLTEFEAIIDEISNLPLRDGLLLLADRLSDLMPEKKLILKLLMREILSSRTNIITQIISIQEELIGKLTEYLQSRIDNEEMKPIQPIIPIQMLISSFLSLLLLDQPLKPAAPYLVEIILDGIQTNK
jgi:AcrR family transcriptional regulator